MNPDNTLLDAVRSGDAAALESLYDRHSSSMYAVALRILADREVAGAALEAVFVGLWEGRLTYTPPYGNAAAWLLRVARDQALAMRPSSPKPVVRGTAPTPRQLVEEVFYGGIRVEEIARTYALPETRVKDLLRSGMAELRSQFEAGR